LAYRSIFNAFFIDLPESFFVFHAEMNSVNLVVACDDFLCITEIVPSKSSVFFIVATLITEVVFKQLLICITV